jgi:hypothetical protein
MSHLWYVMTEVVTPDINSGGGTTLFCSQGQLRTCAPYYTQIHYVGLCVINYCVLNLLLSAWGGLLHGFQKFVEIPNGNTHSFLLF